ncbi:MAG: hypothetical protein PHF70_13700 [Opitutales bacterium]|nr:hypothetical protein [Opitutales bacterium]
MNSWDADWKEAMRRMVGCVEACGGEWRMGWEIPDPDDAEAGVRIHAGIRVYFGM